MASLKVNSQPLDDISVSDLMISRSNSEAGVLDDNGDIELAVPKASGPSKCQKIIEVLRRELLLVLTVLSVLLGTLLGFVLRLSEPSKEAIVLVSLPGELLVRMLKMLIIPLIVSSLISGVAQLDAKASGKMGSRALLYYLFTTGCAVIIGICVVASIHPGDKSMKTDDDEDDSSFGKVSTFDAILDIIRNLFPDNLIRACFQSLKTTQVSIGKELIAKVNSSNLTLNLTGNLTGNETKFNILYKQVTQYQDGMNVLGLIAFCIAFGLVLSRLADQARIIVDFFVALNEVILMLVGVIMWYSPLGILSLIAGKLMEIEDLGAVARQLGLYMTTVVVGLLIHALFVLPLIYFTITRKNPYVFFKGMLQAWLTALGTASSAATLPITFRCLEENNHVDPRVTRFILPIGATVNMDGTALYEAVAAVFIAQLNGIELSIGEYITVSLTATLASIGAASVPGAGLITMLLVLTALSLPSKDILLIYTIDWLLDRIRTSINVLGDAFGAGVVAHLCREDLAYQDRQRATFKRSIRAKKVAELEKIIDRRASLIVRNPSSPPRTPLLEPLTEETSDGAFRKFSDAAKRNFRRGKLCGDGGGRAFFKCCPGNCCIKSETND